MAFSDPDERILGAEGRDPSSQSSQYTSPSSSSDSNDLYNQYDPNDPMRPRPPHAGWSPTRRYIIGAVSFIITAELLTFLMQIANVNLKLHLEQPIFGPQLSWLSWFFVINVLVIVAVWVVLKRLGFFPRMPSDAWRSNSRWREW